ncbi:hypothetical protein [Corynebacterium oculi]|nr:hypothetical protein [Corynebacterium oculi]
MQNEQHLFDADFWLWNPDWGTAEINPEAEMTRVGDSVDQYGHSHGTPVVLTGVRDYRDLGEGEISFDNFGQPICKDGQTTGRTCGVQFLRTRNNIWSTTPGLPGDSGGINFDPNNGEALGTTSKTIFGVLLATQPFDVALEEAYGIPDGQVNERFELPEFTETAEQNDSVLTYNEYQQRLTEWEAEALPAETMNSGEPPTLDDANDMAFFASMYGLAEVRAQAQDAVSTLANNPERLDTVVENAVDGAEVLGEMARQTASVYEQALFAEEETE